MFGLFQNTAEAGIGEGNELMSIRTTELATWPPKAAEDVQTTTLAEYGGSVRIDRAKFGELLSESLKNSYAHHNGKHGAFKGRRYRRGKDRCSFCGARLDAPDQHPLDALIAGIFYSKEPL